MKNFNPRVTIVTPSYNQGKFIESTILSVLNQTYMNIQYILVDGGSKDNTMEIVNKYKEKIDIIFHEKDKGQTDAINKGFKLADGKLVGWINSDDILYPDCVEKIVDLYKKNNDGAIYYGSHLNLIDNKGELVETATLKSIDGKFYLLNKNYDVIQPGSFYSSFLVNKINYLDESLNYCMDLDLWLRLLDHGSIYAYNEKPIAAIRKWEETKTSGGGVFFLREIHRTLKKYGMKDLSPNSCRVKWYILKKKIKPFLYKD